VRIETVVRPGQQIVPFASSSDRGALLGSYFVSFAVSYWQSDFGIKACLEAILLAWLLLRLGWFGTKLARGWTGPRLHVSWSIIDAVYYLLVLIVIVSKYVYFWGTNELDLTAPAAAWQAVVDQRVLLPLRIHTVGNALFGIVCTFKQFKYLRRLPTLKYFAQMISAFGAQLLELIMIIVGVVVVYGIAGYWVFGLSSPAFRNWRTSFAAAFQIVNLAFDYQQLVDSDISLGLMPPVYYFSLIISVNFLLINMFLAVIIGTYDSSREKRAEIELRNLIGKQSFNTQLKELLLPMLYYRFYPFEIEVIDELSKLGACKYTRTLDFLAHVSVQASDLVVSFEYDARRFRCDANSELVIDNSEGVFALTRLTGGVRLLNGALRHSFTAGRDALSESQGTQSGSATTTRRTSFIDMDTVTPSLRGSSVAIVDGHIRVKMVALVGDGTQAGRVSFKLTNILSEGVEHRASFGMFAIALAFPMADGGSVDIALSPRTDLWRSTQMAHRTVIPMSKRISGPTLQHAFRRLMYRSRDVYLHPLLGRLLCLSPVARRIGTVRLRSDEYIEGAATESAFYIASHYQVIPLLKQEQAAAAAAGAEPILADTVSRLDAKVDRLLALVRANLGVGGKGLEVLQDAVHRLVELSGNLGGSQPQQAGAFEADGRDFDGPGEAAAKRPASDAAAGALVSAAEGVSDSGDGQEERLRALRRKTSRLTVRPGSHRSERRGLRQRPPTAEAAETTCSFAAAAARGDALQRAGVTLVHVACGALRVLKKVCRLCPACWMLPKEPSGDAYFSLHAVSPSSHLRNMTTAQSCRDLSRYLHFFADGSLGVVDRARARTPPIA
jgi:hypothetical protein